MTSYSEMARRGREEALATNTSFKLRKVTEVRSHEEPYPFRRDSGWQPKTITVYELIAECGHVLETAHHTPRGHWEWWIKEGKKRRCKKCPIPPKQPRPDGCQYEVGVEVVRECGNKSVTTVEGWGRLCRKHHQHLIDEGYLE